MLTLSFFPLRHRLEHRLPQLRHHHCCHLSAGRLLELWSSTDSYKETKRRIPRPTVTGVLRQSVQKRKEDKKVTMGIGRRTEASSVLSH